MRQTNPSCTSGPTFGWHRKFLWNITFQSCPNFFGFASTNSPSLIPKVPNIHTTGLIWSQYLKSHLVANLRDEWSLKSGWIFRKNSKGRGGVESFSIQQIPLQIFAIFSGKGGGHSNPKNFVADFRTSQTVACTIYVCSWGGGGRHGCSPTPAYY